MAKKPILAIMYDFDSTLAKGDMQNYGFIPSLGMTPDEFWSKTAEFSGKSKVESVLSYMYVMVQSCREKGILCTKEWFKEHGKNIKYFDGVLTWFDRINNYGKEHGVKVEHYLVSSGTKEILDGCAIAKEFKKIFACEFYFDEKTKLPIWPKLTINYTQKTQYYYRICKGIINPTEDAKLNSKTYEKRIPYRNMVYLGDGMTDVPCMILVKENGGNSIAVYTEEKKNQVKKLFDDGRTNFIAKADYSPGSQIEKIIHLIIRSVKIQNDMNAQIKKGI